MVETDFDDTTPKEFLYNEILLPVIEKLKFLDANERCLDQLLDQYQKSEKGGPKAYRCKKKSHTTLFPKKFIPLSLEDLKFLIGCCAWRVTKIYSHYTFEQNAFKKDFVLNNKKERQNAKSDVERDFFKLMNYANFGVDFRNNANNSTFELISEKINEISY